MAIGDCAACKCDGQRVSPGWAFCSGLVFGRMGAVLVLCEKHAAEVEQFRAQMQEQFGGKRSG